MAPSTDETLKEPTDDAAQSNVQMQPSITDSAPSNDQVDDIAAMEHDNEAMPSHVDDLEELVEEDDEVVPDENSVPAITSAPVINPMSTPDPSSEPEPSPALESGPSPSQNPVIAPFSAIVPEPSPEPSQAYAPSQSEAPFALPTAAPPPTPDLASSAPAITPKPLASMGPLFASHEFSASVSTDTPAANPQRVPRPSLSIMGTAWGKNNTESVYPGSEVSGPSKGPISIFGASAASSKASAPEDETQDDERLIAAAKAVIKNSEPAESVDTKRVVINPFGFGRRTAAQPNKPALKKKTAHVVLPPPEMEEPIGMGQPLFSFGQSVNEEKRPALFGVPPPSFAGVGSAIAKSAWGKPTEQIKPKDAAKSSNAGGTQPTSASAPFGASARGFVGFGSVKSTSPTKPEAGEEKPAEPSKLTIFGKPYSFSGNAFPSSSNQPERAQEKSAELTKAATFGNPSPFGGSVLQSSNTQPETGQKSPTESSKAMTFGNPSSFGGNVLPSSSTQPEAGQEKPAEPSKEVTFGIPSSFGGSVFPSSSTQPEAGQKSPIKAGKLTIFGKPPSFSGNAFPSSSNQPERAQEKSAELTKAATFGNPSPFCGNVFQSSNTQPETGQKSSAESSKAMTFGNPSSFGGNVFPSSSTQPEAGQEKPAEPSKEVIFGIPSSFGGSVFPSSSTQPEAGQEKPAEPSKEVTFGIPSSFGGKVFSTPNTGGTFVTPESSSTPFGQQAKPVIFGGAVVPQSSPGSSSNLFGQQTKPVIFGGAVVPQSPSGSSPKLFEQQEPVIFGGVVVPQPSGVFANVNQQTQTNPFGSSTPFSTSTFRKPAVFGSSAATPFGKDAEKSKGTPTSESATTDAIRTGVENEAPSTNKLSATVFPTEEQKKSSGFSFQESDSHPVAQADKPIFAFGTSKSFGNGAASASDDPKQKEQVEEKCFGKDDDGKNNGDVNMDHESSVEKPFARPKLQLHQVLNAPADTFAEAAPLSNPENLKQKAPKAQPLFGFGGASSGVSVASLTSPKPSEETKPVSTPLFGVAQIPAKGGLIKFSKRPSFQTSLSPGASTFTPGAELHKAPSSIPKSESSQELEQSKSASMELESPDQAAALEKSDSVAQEASLGTQAVKSTTASLESSANSKMWSLGLSDVGLLVMRPATTDNKRTAVTKKDGVYKFELFKDSTAIYLCVVRTDVTPEESFVKLEVKSDLVRAGRIKGRPDRLAVTRLGRAVPVEPSEADPVKFYAVFQTAEDCTQLLSALGKALNGEKPAPSSSLWVQASLSAQDEPAPSRPKDSDTSTVKDKSASIPETTKPKSALLLEKLKHAKAMKAMGKPLSLQGPPTSSKSDKDSLSVGKNDLPVSSENKAIKSDGVDSSAAESISPEVVSGAKRHANTIIVDLKNKKQKGSDGKPRSTKLDGETNSVPSAPSFALPPAVRASSQSHVQSMDLETLEKLEDVSTKYEACARNADSAERALKKLRTDSGMRVTALENKLKEARKENIKVREENSELKKKNAVIQSKSHEQENVVSQTMKALEELTLELSGVISNKVELDHPSFRMCRPLSSDDYFQRLWSFKPSLWLGFAEKRIIDPVECALHGWRNSAANELASSEGAIVKLDAGAYLDSARQHAEVERVRSLITGKGHALLSGWKGNKCPEEFRTLTARLRDGTELAHCVDQLSSANLESYVALDNKQQVGNSVAHSIAAFNWKLRDEAHGASELTCEWCRRNCVAKDARFNVQTSHYAHCPFRVSGAVAANLSALSTKLK